jgi:hypothetical protein
LPNFKVDVWFEKFTFIEKLPDDFLDDVEAAVTLAVQEAGGTIVGVSAYQWAH